MTFVCKNTFRNKNLRAVNEMYDSAWKVSCKRVSEGVVNREGEIRGTNEDDNIKLVVLLYFRLVVV